MKFQGSKNRTKIDQKSIKKWSQDGDSSWYWFFMDFLWFWEGSWSQVGIKNRQKSDPKKHRKTYQNRYIFGPGAPGANTKYCGGSTGPAKVRGDQGFHAPPQNTFFKTKPQPELEYWAQDTELRAVQPRRRAQARWRIILISDDIAWIRSYQDTQGLSWVGLCVFGWACNGQKINFWGKPGLKQVPSGRNEF